MTPRQTFVNALRRIIGRPYHWGGQTVAQGFDCSGAVVWAMRHVYPEYPDLSAHGLWLRYQNHQKERTSARPGDIMFYGYHVSDISHVMVVLDIWGVDCDMVMGTLVGARGGDALTTYLPRAFESGARVDVAGFDYWSTRFQGMCDPFEGD